MQFLQNGLTFKRPREPISPAIGEPAEREWRIFVLAAVWLSLIYVLLGLNASLYETLILTVILTTLLIPIVLLLMRGDLDIFEPIVFANIALASMFVGRPVFDIYSANWARYSFGTFITVRPGFDRMLFYAWLGIFALQLGYLSPFPKKISDRLPALRKGLDIRKSIQISMVLFVIGAVLFEEYIRQSGGVAFLAAYLTARGLGGLYSFKKASGYLFIGPLLWPPAGLISLAVWLKSRRLLHLVLTVLILACFFVSLLGGVGRTYAIQGILGIFLMIYVIRNKRPNFALLLLLACILLVYFVYDREARGHGSFEQKKLILDKAVHNPIEAIQSIWSEEDAAMCDYFSVMVTEIPSRISFGKGSVTSDILLRAYPRFLWPGHKKPDEHMVHLFKVFFPAIFYRYTTGVAFSVIGELYADYGGIAIFVGMFLFGIILAIPKLWLRSSYNAIPAQLLFVSMPAYTISLMRGGIPAFVEYLAITILAITLLVGYAGLNSVRTTFHYQSLRAR
jgi:hypothetical protein